MTLAQGISWKRKDWLGLMAYSFVWGHQVSQSVINPPEVPWCLDHFCLKSMILRMPPLHQETLSSSFKECASQLLCFSLKIFDMTCSNFLFNGQCLIWLTNNYFFFHLWHEPLVQNWKINSFSPLFFFPREKYICASRRRDIEPKVNNYQGL